MHDNVKLENIIVFLLILITLFFPSSSLLFIHRNDSRFAHFNNNFLCVNSICVGWK